jgi:hypothetical protein
VYSAKAKKSRDQPEKIWSAENVSRGEISISTKYSRLAHAAVNKTKIVPHKKIHD